MILAIACINMTSLLARAASYPPLHVYTYVACESMSSVTVGPSICMCTTHRAYRLPPLLFRAAATTDVYVGFFSHLACINITDERNALFNA
jgi:hypothetical protein